MLKDLASLAVKYAYQDLIPAFEAASGATVDTTWSSTAAIVGQVASDEPFDLVITGAGNIERFIAEGTVRTGSRVDLMQSGIGLAVKAGTPRPDIGSAVALKQALLDAKSIGFSQGPSGVYLLWLFETMGIAEVTREKATQSTPGTPVARYVADGTVDLGFQQVSEMIHEPGITFLGPLPPEIQCVTVFSSGVLARAAAPAEARALQVFLSGEAAVAAIRKNGMEPARS